MEVDDASAAAHSSSFSCWCGVSASSESALASNCSAKRVRRARSSSVGASAESARSDCVARASKPPLRIASRSSWSEASGKGPHETRSVASEVEETSTVRLVAE